MSQWRPSDSDPNTANPVREEPKGEQGRDGMQPGAKFDKNGMLLINAQGLELVQHFESCFLKAYLDAVKVPTIAWGRIVYPNGRKVRLGDTCTQAEADQWLLEDLWGEGAKYVRAFLDDSVETELNPNQFSALVSFTYNRGAGRFRDYVAGFLNRRDFTGAINSLLKVNWAGENKEYLLGLDRRRHAEALLWAGDDWRKVDSVAKFGAYLKASK